MSFHDKLKKILDKEKPKIFNKLCSNFWCKVWFEVREDHYRENSDHYSQCPKCRGYSSDPLMSSGVENNGTREYEGSRYDESPHETLFKEYKDGKFE